MKNLVIPLLLYCFMSPLNAGGTPGEQQNIFSLAERVNQDYGALNPNSNVQNVTINFPQFSTSLRLPFCLFNWKQCCGYETWTLRISTTK